jgi:hypothetical protein
MAERHVHNQAFYDQNGMSFFPGAEAQPEERE